ncbi:agmatine deiminase family protein [Sedimentisphaerales bacterium M17dextr]|uniref:Agmatine deiminase family protein n=2 Tax=Anaerobaca lacustris TaxID=3044600 RepID=A0AAW6U0Z7_9BACT|nr:agmatine deiminase family protein [Sedimentisphaerales bacterium M17dextr]
MMTHESNTPAASGFHMPAEWDEHEATWLGWPHNRTDWPGKIAPIHWVYGEIVRKIAPGEIVRILVNSERHETQVRRILKRVGVDSGRVELFHFPTNRGWTRDFGPIFVRRNEPREVAIARFRFNAWAKYPDWDLDCHIAERVAETMGRRIFHVRHGGEDVVLEGGAIDVNGCGTLLTTEECLLDDKVQVRNPKLGRGDIEQVCRDYLGAGHVLWLARGIVGDDTHGHVDDLCRFVSPGTVVLCEEKNAGDENHWILEENRERLEGFRLQDGSRIDVVRLPMPEPLYLDGQRLPASYANFYIANSAVLVPTFNDPNDRIALGILADLFRDRPVVGIHAVDLVWGLGTLHCLTQQEPAA